MVVLNGKAKQSKRLSRKRLFSRCESAMACDADYAPGSKYFLWKSVLGWLLAAVLMVLLLPLVLILMAIVRMTSSGPGLFRQERTGKDGKPFTMYKIRTMAENAEEKTGAIWAEVRDPRVTGVGRVLRRLHLDELPQLLNVLKGQMALVGPRPERPEFVFMLSKRISGYKKRLAVKPGITGLAQLNLPPDSDLESVRCKLVLDLEYSCHASFFLDIRIIICTALRLFKLPERLSLRLFGLGRSVSAEQLERHKPLLEKPTFAGGRRPQPKSEASLEDACPSVFPERVAGFVKQLLNDADVDNPVIQQCVERGMRRSFEATMQNLPADSDVSAQPGPIPE